MRDSGKLMLCPLLLYIQLSRLLPSAKSAWENVGQARFLFSFSRLLLSSDSREVVFFLNFALGGINSSFCAAHTRVFVCVCVC